MDSQPAVNDHHFSLSMLTASNAVRLNSLLPNYQSAAR